MGSDAEKALEHFVGRTDAKLRYARLILDELSNDPERGRGQDFERAHQEAFLFQLAGVVDAFLQELNARHVLAIKPGCVNLSSVGRAFSGRGLSNEGLDELNKINGDKSSWYRTMKTYRNHVTHRQHIPRIYSVGGPDSGQVRFLDLHTGDPVTKDVLGELAYWLACMGELTEMGRP